MPKRGRPTAAERAERDDRVLAAATEHFLASGFAGTSLDAVAAAAGVTKRTIYTTFTDKAGLLAAVVRRQHTYSTTTGGDLLDTATGIVTTLLADDAIALHRLVLAEAIRFPDLARGFHDAGPGSAQAALVASGVDPDDAADVFTLLLGEHHRRRLLGLEGAPTAAAARDHAVRVLARFGPGD